MQNFNEIIDLNKNIVTTFHGKQLILLNLKLYDGPITLQLLPFGGIQSVFNYNIIINCRNGFISSDKVIYDGQEMSAKEFILMFDNIVNEVLPN